MKNALSPETRNLALRILGGHRLMTLATNRADGWPQATTVAYVNEELVIYCFVSRMSQKFMNIERDRRVSLSIAGDFTAPENIQGLSLAALAEVVEDKSDYLRISRLFSEKSPEYGSWPNPNPSLAPLLRLVPVVISVIDYTKTFGHSELVTLTAHDLRHPATVIN
jgi:general stress protein 26